MAISEGVRKKLALRAASRTEDRSGRGFLRLLRRLRDTREHDGFRHILRPLLTTSVVSLALPFALLLLALPFTFPFPFPLSVKLTVLRGSGIEAGLFADTRTLSRSELRRARYLMDGTEFPIVVTEVAVCLSRRVDDVELGHCSGQ